MRIAIVSTYGIECGIARFTEVLKNGLSKAPEIEVKVFDLPPHELKRSFGATKSGANVFIENLCAKLKDFDAVSVQCEYSIFADTLTDSVERLKKVLMANSNTTLTLHTVISRSTSSDFNRPSVTQWLSHPRRALSNLLSNRQHTIPAVVEAELLGFCKSEKIKLIVHTKTTRDILKYRFKIDNVDCHPLCYNSAESLAGFNHDSCRAEIVARYKFESTDKLIGVFGFFGHYKGFDYAIRGLSRMGDEYKLLIYSGLHPNSIRHSDTSQIDSLVELAKKLNVLDKVFFMGSVDDASLYKAIAGVDYCWLPYREVGQEASAICSEVAELSRRMIISRNFAFSDYMNFGLREDYEFFEIGNIEELKFKTNLYDTLNPKDHDVSPGVDFLAKQSSFYLENLRRNPA